MHSIGIRTEDKGPWERRAPLAPDDVRRLHQTQGIPFVVQTSTTRVFPDAQYGSAGAQVADGLADCAVVLGVKEIPVSRLEPGKTYVFFSHTIKGQSANMPMLRRLMELRCQLIDYEKITDAQGRRLVFFGRFAGIAGMIDTLWTLGRQWECGVSRRAGTECGVERDDSSLPESPFSALRPAHAYADAAQAREAVTAVGERIRSEGLPEALRPFVCGFAGYGNVSQGAQEIFDLLPIREIAPHELPGLAPAANVCHKVVFREEHMVERIDASAPFQLQEYYQHPERYQARFAPHLPHLTVLVNGIYWEPKYPRLLTLDDVRSLWSRPTPPKLRVIGDISCDINGSIECTVRATDPGNPVYVYEPASGGTRDGVAGHGPVVLAVDTLPCELPVDSSRHFSEALSPLLPALAAADYSRPLESAGLPDELRKATILWHGALTEPYRYLKEFVS